ICATLFFFIEEDGIRDSSVTGVQTCALPICFSCRCSVGAGFPPKAGRQAYCAARGADGGDCLGGTRKGYEKLTFTIVVRLDPAEIGRASCRERVNTSGEA